MSLQQATNIYNTLLKTIQQFQSPVFQNYFEKKARDDYTTLIGKIDEGKYKCVLPKYIEEQKNLNDTLKRQSQIYNMYYDRTSNI